MKLTSMDIARQYFGEKIFNQIVVYLKKDPAANLRHVLKLVEKAAVLPEHRTQVQNLQQHFENNPVVQNYISRILTEVDENVQHHLLVNFFVNASLFGIPRQRRLAETLGHAIPFTILIDPTSNCNLRCTGCWAGAYEKSHSLSFEDVDRIVAEGKELGIYFIVLSGGEPMLWPHLYRLCEKHPDVAFMFYTNGTLIDREAAEKMRQLGNMSPAISLEGDREATDERRGKGVFDKTMKAMELLKEHGVIFGFSLTITSKNWEDVYSDEFIDLLIEKGALYGWSFHYIPIGSNPDLSLMLDAGQRAALVERVRYLRANKPIQVADFWNDGHLTNGCIAGGRRYFHITASGDVEPCAFIHFAREKINGKSLQEILASPLFRAYQKRQPFSENMLRPCPLIDVPQALRDIVKEANPQPTHDGADAILNGETAASLDQIAATWEKEADALKT